MEQVTKWIVLVYLLQPTEEFMDIQSVAIQVPMMAPLLQPQMVPQNAIKNLETTETKTPQIQVKANKMYEAMHVLPIMMRPYAFVYNPSVGKEAPKGGYNYCCPCPCIGSNVVTPLPHTCPCCSCQQPAESESDDCDLTRRHLPSRHNRDFSSEYY